MTSQTEALVAARAIVEARTAAAPSDLLPKSRDRLWTPTELRARVLTKLDARESARLQLLVAEGAIDRPEPSSVGKPWSGRFAHAMASHFANSASESSEIDQEAALLVADAEMRHILNASGATATSVRLREIGMRRDDYAWLLALGMTQTQFQSQLDVLRRFHKRALSAPRARDVTLTARTQVGPSAGSIPQQRATRTPTTPSVPVVEGHSRPTWLAVGGPDSSAAPLTSPTWQPTDPADIDTRESLDDSLSNAWNAFASGAITDADALLSPVYAGFGTIWQPMPGPDGHIFWAWIRLVRLVSIAREASHPARRLAAVSAVELIPRIGVEKWGLERLDEELVEVAMNGLSPDLRGSLSRPFAAYSGRLVSAIGHQMFFEYLDYSNDDRARARASWAQEFPGLGLSDRSSSAEFALALEKAFKELRYRTTELSKNSRLSDRFMDSLNRGLELLDEAEQGMVDEAIGLLADTLTCARSGLGVAVPTVRTLDADLAASMAEVAGSGSLLLQETLFLGLSGARILLREQLDTASRVSHPEVVAELVSTKLPLSARTPLPFRIQFRVRNSGNTAAREVWLRIAADGLSFERPIAEVEELAPSGEREVAFLASVIEPTATVSMTLQLTWSDDLAQEFASQSTYLAEDQRASSWNTGDANPYSLSTINDPHRLVGRTKESASLEGILRMSDSTYVTGLKRVGKSSLVRTLLQRLGHEAGWAISTLELGQMLGGSKSPSAIARGLMDGVSEAFEDLGIEVPSIDFAGTDDDYARIVGRWLRGIERRVPDLSSYHLVVSIDDFDGIPPEFVDGDDGPGLFLFLRSLVDKPWLSLIFIGSENMPKVIASQGHQLNQVRRTPLDHFTSKEDTAQLLRTPAVHQLDWSEESVEATHQLSNGNPYYATMVAQRVWDALRDLDRTLVEPSDIADAAAHVANNQDPFHFSHMWADDPTGMAPKSRRAMLSAALLLSAARCADTANSSSSIEETIAIAQGIAGDATAAELKMVLQGLFGRDIMTLSTNSKNISIRVPLLGDWLRSRGRRELEAEFEQFTRARGIKRAIPTRDLVTLATNLSYAGHGVNELKLQAWLEQFGEDPRDRYLAFLLLQRLVTDGYFTSRKIYRSILPKIRDEIHRSVPEIVVGRQNYLSNVIIVNHGRQGSSGPAVQTHLHQILRVKKENCVAIADVAARMQKIDNPVVVVMDDFSGTGQQLEKSVSSLCAELDHQGEWRSRTVLLVGAAIAARSTLGTKESFGEADVRTIVGNPVTFRLHAFHPEAAIFESEDDRMRAKDLVEVIGNSLLPNNPLGWGGQGLLVLLESNCPNNTLPIFWQNGKYAGGDWRALFPRGV